MSYQADVHDNFRRAARYVDRILKGTKPADLPIYQSARYARRQCEGGACARSDPAIKLPCPRGSGPSMMCTNRRNCRNAPSWSLAHDLVTTLPDQSTHLDAA